jgi:hypothetical protein
MPWVRLDDRFPSHRKIRLLSHQAFRLYVSGLCYASENLTDGRIPASELRIVADVRSGKSAAKELVERGLWRDNPDGGWIIHDYHDYNPTADQVRADRAARTERQARWRAGKKAKPKQPGAGTDAPGPVDAVDARVDASTDASRDAPVTPAPYPSPYPVVPPTEVQLAGAPAAGQIPMIGDKPRVPTNCQPLVDAITAARMPVGWDLRAGEWLLIEALIKRCGIHMLVQHAVSMWEGARRQPQSAKYFLPGWRTLPDAPTADSPAPGPLTKNQIGRALLADAANQLAEGAA